MTDPEDDPPALSVVLCTHNGSATILEQVDAVLAQRPEVSLELVVVDNDSTDGVADLVRDHVGTDRRVVVITARERRRLGYARNAGAHAARGTHVTFIDDDDRVAPGWGHALLTALEDHRVVAMRLVLDEINDPIAAQSRTHPQMRGVEDFLGVPAASMIALRREDFLAIGGYDELIPSAEDIDFALRLHEELGEGPHWCADAIYHYRLRAEPRRAFRQGLSYGRAVPTVYRRWRDRLDRAGRPSAGAAVRDWLRLLAMTPLCATDRARRVRWAFRCGLRMGRVQGSIRERVVFL